MLILLHMVLFLTKMEKHLKTEALSKSYSMSCILGHREQIGTFFPIQTFRVSKDWNYTPTASPFWARVEIYNWLSSTPITPYLMLSNDLTGFMQMSKKISERLDQVSHFRNLELSLCSPITNTDWNQLHRKEKNPSAIFISSPPKVFHGGASLNSVSF